MIPERRRNGVTNPATRLALQFCISILSAEPSIPDRPTPPMRIATLLIFVLIFTGTTRGATDAEINTWKQGFPRVGVDSSFGLRQMASRYEVEVLHVTKTNVDSAIRRLRNRAEDDIKEAARAAGSASSSAKEAKEKLQWLTHQLLPFVRTMG